MARPMVATNSRRGRSPNATQPNRVTTTGVKLHSTVALATEVMTMPKCQNDRSRTKEAAASAIHFDGRPTPSVPGPAVSSRSSGRAKAKRQKPAAAGPVPVRRTRIGAKASTQAEAIRTSRVEARVGGMGRV